MKRYGFLAVIGMVLGVGLATMTTTGCKSGSINPICEAAKIAAAPVSELAGSPEVLNCEAPEELEAWMVEKLMSTNICTTAEKLGAKGLVGGIVCPKLADKLKSTALGVLPAKAKCTGGGLVGTGRDKFIAACISVIQI